MKTTVKKQKRINRLELVEFIRKKDVETELRLL